MKRDGKDAGHVLAEVDTLKANVKELETIAAQVDADVQQLLLTIPNKPHHSVPVGHSEKENKVTIPLANPLSFHLKRSSILILAKN